MGQLQYIASTNGSFNSVLAQNVTQYSIIEEKFLSTDYSNIFHFGTDYADVIVRHWNGTDDMYWYNGGGFQIASYWTLNEEHTVYYSTSEYKFDEHTFSVTGTCNIPNSPVYKSVVKGRLYYFTITTNDVVTVNLVAWEENGVVGLKDLVSGNFYQPSSGTWTAGPPYTPPTPPTPTSNSKIYLGSTNLGTGKIRLGANDVSAIYLGTSLIYPPQTPLYQNVVCFTALQANVDIAYTHPDDLGFTPKFYASTDGVNFTQMTKQVPVTLSNIGDKLYIYGDNQYLCNQTDISKYAYFLMSGGDVTVGGDLTTLLDVNGLTTLPDRAFVATLQSTYLISAADLTVNVTSVGDYALYKLFEGNTNMTSGINALPATTLGDYCYARMYYGCEKLTTTPTTLPATTLTDSCYRAMYYGCELITNAPSLPATTLDASCYEDMFNGCVALQNVTATLPATTTAIRCYYGMFNNCDSLQTAPEIYATAFTPSEFGYMFNSCNALNSITVRCTSWDTSTDSRWVENVASSGTFTKPTATVIPSGMNGIPTGWTVVNV